jgi:hypothetical protein
MRHILLLEYPLAKHIPYFVYGFPKVFVSLLISISAPTSAYIPYNKSIGCRWLLLPR